MKNIAKKAVASTKKFVEDHKVGIAIIGTALVAVKVNKLALRDHENFLREHGLYDEYYSLHD